MLISCPSVYFTIENGGIRAAEKALDLGQLGTG
jgi:hypothetical protein